MNSLNILSWNKHNGSMYNITIIRLSHVLTHIHLPLSLPAILPRALDFTGAGALK